MDVGAFFIGLAVFGAGTLALLSSRLFSSKNEGGSVMRGVTTVKSTVDLGDYTSALFGKEKAQEIVIAPQKDLITIARPILDLIGKHESNGNYNIIYGGAVQPLTRWSLSQVQAFQDSLVKGGAASSAVGKYQFIRKTLAGLIDEMGLPLSQKFDETTQDSLALHLLKRRGLLLFLDGKISESTFILRLSQEWASLPKDASGKSYYAGDGLNKALVNYASVQYAVRQVKGLA